MDFFIQHTKITEHLETKVVKLNTNNLRKAFPDFQGLDDQSIIELIEKQKGGLNAYNPTDEDFYKTFDDTSEEAESLLNYRVREAEEKEFVQVFAQPEDWDYSLWNHEANEAYVNSSSENELKQIRIKSLQQLPSHNIETP